MTFQVENLACRRGMRMVFRNISFSLRSGEVLLFTGPNGSGKSSLLRVLAGLLPPQQGDIRWNGQAIDMADHRSRLHYLGHYDAVKPELTVAEMLDYWRVLQSGSEALSPVFGLEELKKASIRYLSAGQKRRLALARLVVKQAPLWLLDEPLTSLDQAGQELLKDLVRQHRTAGGMAIIATHHGMDLPGAQQLSFAGVSA